MIILSNGFPTNMPNSEEVSQGGPANFARLFSAHIISAAPNKWIGIMFCGSNSKRVQLNKSFSFPQRDYFKLYLPKKFFRLITRAKKIDDPARILQEPIKRMALLIKKEKPDIVFLNGFGLLNWILLKAAEETGVSVVIQHAGIWTKELRLHKHLYSPAGLKIMEEMERDSTRLSVAEVFLNTWSRDYYHKHIAKKPFDSNVIIPLPFDFLSFSNTPKEQRKSVLISSNRAFRIGIIARWDKIKNHKAILSLARAARQKGLPWQFFAVTKIPDSYRLRAKKKSYEKNIKVIRSLNRVGISDFCRSMDLLILPSLFDVSPTVVLEAVATKTPIAISSNVGYVHDFKKYGAKEWVIDFKDTTKTLRRVKKLLHKPMPQLLQNQIMANHDHKKVFLAYLNLFETITAKNKIVPIITQNAVSSLDLI